MEIKDVTDSTVLSIFGDSSRMKILGYLLEFPTNEFTPKDLVESIGMSRTTVFRELDSLLDENMIKQVGRIGKSFTFKINLKNPIVELVQQSVHLRSDLTADKQIASRKVRRVIRKTLKDYDALKLRKKRLREELNYTNEKLKSITVR